MAPCTHIPPLGVVPDGGIFYEKMFGYFPDDRDRMQLLWIYHGQSDAPL